MNNQRNLDQQKMKGILMNIGSSKQMDQSFEFDGEFEFEGECEGEFEEPDVPDDYLCDDELVDEFKVDEEFVKNQQKIGLMCNCKLETVCREVKKEGPTKGRSFYVCSKNQSDESKCNYFMWKNAPSVNNQVTRPQIQATATSTPFEQQPALNYKQQQKKGLMCYCKLKTVCREVKKEGPNIGKEFYVCCKPQSDGSKCNYFKWKDTIEE
jgi:hypothetical protein